MARQNIAATATEADWSFLNDPEMAGAIRSAAIRASREFEAVSYEDAHQDAALYLAVRPELQNDYRENDHKAGWLAQQVYSHGLRESAMRQSNRNKNQVSVDALLDTGGI